MSRLAAIRNRKKQTVPKINLVPILDGTFIFIFFVLYSTQFVSIFQVENSLPLIVNEELEQKVDQNALNLLVKISKEKIFVYTGTPAVLRKTFTTSSSGYDALHDFLVGLKKNNMKEDVAILEPDAQMNYQEVVAAMDALRLLKDKDYLYIKRNKEGDQYLFRNVVLGNIQDE